MLNKEDIQKFYLLLARLDITSPNIGVVGDFHRFERIIKYVITENKSKNIPTKLNSSRTKLTIFYDDEEISYIYISNPKDLVGRKFRKYI